MGFPLELGIGARSQKHCWLFILTASVGRRVHKLTTIHMRAIHFLPLPYFLSAEPVVTLALQSVHSQMRPLHVWIIHFLAMLPLFQNPEFCPHLWKEVVICTYGSANNVASIRTYRSANNRIGCSHLQILVKHAHNTDNSHSKCLTKAETQAHEQQHCQLSLTNRETHFFASTMT